MKSRGLNFRKKRIKISSGLWREMGEWAFGISLALLLAFALVYSAGNKTSVIGASMEPSLYNGQEILINRIVYKLSSPKRGDVIVFQPNGNESSHYYVKRVIGIPGDKIQIQGGKVYIEGSLYQEITIDDIADPGLAKNEITLGIDEYFVLGDNRNNSEDSRFGNIGNVNKSSIIGKAWFRMVGSKKGIGFIK